jgi:hypothetical protein
VRIGEPQPGECSSSPKRVTHAPVRIHAVDSCEVSNAEEQYSVVLATWSIALTCHVKLDLRKLVILCAACDCINAQYLCCPCSDDFIVCFMPCSCALSDSMPFQATLSVGGDISNLHQFTAHNQQCRLLAGPAFMVG